jgi:hypothetical protein
MLKPLSPNKIPDLVVVQTMLTTIDFNNQPFSRTKKINDVRANRRLTPESQAFDAGLSQSAPKPKLRLRHLPSH